MKQLSHLFRKASSMVRAERFRTHLKLLCTLQTWPHLIIAHTLLSFLNHLSEVRHRMIWVLCLTATGLANASGRIWSQPNPKTVLFTDGLKASPDKNNTEEHGNNDQPWITLPGAHDYLQSITTDVIKTWCKLLHFLRLRCFCDSLWLTKVT